MSLIFGKPREGKIDDPIEAVTAAAGALEETAKTTGKAIDATRELGGWFDGKLGGALEAAIGWAIEDPLIERRLASQIRRRERLILLARQSQARLSQMGVTALVQPADKVIFPLLEAASLEDDASLQELWANLLASAVAGEDGVQRLYISILTELTPAGALALRDYYLETEHAVKPPWPERGYKHAPGSLDGDLYGVDVTGGLFRLGLVEPASIIFDVVQDIRQGRSNHYSDDDIDPVTNEISVPGDLYRVVLTALGREFCRAVGIEKSPKEV